MKVEPSRLERIDAFVVAWLPGSEGAGVADDYDPLYPYGFGLRTR